MRSDSLIKSGSGWQLPKITLWCPNLSRSVKDQHLFVDIKTFFSMQILLFKCTMMWQWSIFGWCGSLSWSVSNTQKPGQCVIFSLVFFTSPSLFDGQSAFSCSFRWHFKVGGVVCANWLIFRQMDVTVDPWDRFPPLRGYAADRIVSFWVVAFRVHGLVVHTEVKVGHCCR